HVLRAPPPCPTRRSSDLVVVLKTATVCETNGRYYVTARLDTFLRVDNAGVELVAKLIQGWVGKTVDHNFAETIGFLGSVSRTAEDRKSTRLNSSHGKISY